MGRLDRKARKRRPHLVDLTRWRAFESVAALGVLVTLMTMALAALPGSSRATTPHGCRDVMFIGARGSGEPQRQWTDNGKATTIGKPLYYMAELLETDVLAYGETMGILPVIYRADSVLELKPSKAEIELMVAAGLGGALRIFEDKNLKPYEASIAEGVKETIADVHAVTARCPETEVVLAGYSQGAMAVHQAELQLDRDGDEEALDAIGGTLLLGDGDRAPGTHAKIFGGAPAGGEGVQVYFRKFKPLDVVEPETTAEICVRGDVVCDFKLHLDKAFYGEGIHVHSSYDVEPQKIYLRQAVAWLAEEMGLTG
jgi:cutinase